MPPSLLRDGLVAEYRFDRNAADTSDSGRHGVVHGATLTTDRFGSADHAYHFDGIDDYIEVAPPPEFASEFLTVSVWVRCDSRDFRGWTNCIVAQDDGNDEDQSRRVFQLSTDCGHFVWHRMIGARDPMFRRRVRPDRWYHLAAVHERGVHRLYVDGVLQDSVEHKLWTHDCEPMYIGRKGTPEPHFYFRGTIDDVRLYNRALSELEIALLVNEGGWKVPAPADLVGEGDPLSGRWGQDGVVFLDLAYDGDRRVTGRIMSGRPDNMAYISTGTFDRGSGELRLEGNATDPHTGAPGAFVIAGILDEREVNVCARFRGFSGNFMLTREGTRLRPTRRSLRSNLGALAFRCRRWLRRS